MIASELTFYALYALQGLVTHVPNDAIAESELFSLFLRDRVTGVTNALSVAAFYEPNELFETLDRFDQMVAHGTELPAHSFLALLRHTDSNRKKTLLVNDPLCDGPWMWLRRETLSLMVRFLEAVDKSANELASRDDELRQRLRTPILCNVPRDAFAAKMWTDVAFDFLLIDNQIWMLESLMESIELHRECWADDSIEYVGDLCAIVFVLKHDDTSTMVQLAKWLGIFISDNPLAWKRKMRARYPLVAESVIDAFENANQ